MKKMIGKSYNLLDLDQLQFDISKWRKRNFGPASQAQVGDRMLGVVEELGELAHLLLKERQGIREGHDIHDDEFHSLLKDAIGDLLIFLMGVADLLGLTLSECLEFAWAEVQHRDWVKFPKDGVSK